MIILIGGASHTGKSFMAQQLLEKYKYPSFSIDHLKMGLFRAETGCGFTPTDSNELIGEKLWPILKGIIMTCAENNQNIVMEGCYLFPEKINELGPKYLHDVISFYLGFSPSYIEKYYESKIRQHGSVIEQRGEPDETGTVERYIAENQKQKMICEKSNAQYFEIKNDYEKEMGYVYHWIDSLLSQKMTEKKRGNPHV